jgi:hypothetical protein
MRSSVQPSTLISNRNAVNPSMPPDIHRTTAPSQLSRYSVNCRYDDDDDDDDDEECLFDWSVGFPWDN